MRIDASTVPTPWYVHSTGSCGSSVNNIHDADVYNGNAYTAHYSTMVNKWEVGWNTAGTGAVGVQEFYNYQYPNHSGIDFDDNTARCTSACTTPPPRTTT